MKKAEQVKKEETKKSIAKKTVAPKKAEPVKKTPVKTETVKKSSVKNVVSKKTPEIKIEPVIETPEKVSVKKTADKTVDKKAAPAVKAKIVEAPIKEEKVAKVKASEIESDLLVPGTRFLKTAFFSIVEKEDNPSKYAAFQKNSDKPTACSRPKIVGAMDSKNLVELLSQQLEYENRSFFEGCAGQICVKCNVNNVDPKYYVDKSLGYCVECAALLGLGQSKEGVFSDAQMELMRRSMEKSIGGKGASGDDDDIESVFGDMDSLELEEALLAAEADLDI